MNPDLKALIQLQEIDLRIQDLEKQIQDIPAQIQTLEQTLETDRQRLETSRHTLTEKQKHRRKLEQDAEAFRSKLSRLKDQLMSVKTNKEYTAMLREIELCDGDIRNVEDQILEMMEAVENLTAVVQKAEKQVQEESARTRVQHQELEERVASFRSRIDALTAERSGTAQRVSSDLLESYRRICAHRKGIGIAEARDECCLACHVRLRPQAFNEVKRNDRIITCDTCGRILYWIAPPAAATAAPMGDAPVTVLEPPATL